MQGPAYSGTPSRCGSPSSVWRRVSDPGAHARDPKGSPLCIALHPLPPRLLLPAVFNLRLALDPAGSPPQRQPGSPRPLTSSAGPARPAAALSLRVREILCPGSGPPSPRAPPPSGSVARLPWPRQPAASNRCQLQKRRGHIWLCFALILAPPHHLTNKKPRPATTHPSRPHRPLPRDSLSATTHRRVPAELGAQHLERDNPAEGARHSPLPSPAA